MSCGLLQLKLLEQAGVSWICETRLRMEGMKN